MIADPARRNSLSYRFRSKRDVMLRQFLLDARPHGRTPCRIVDLGGGAAYWERVGMDWLGRHGFEVLCINHDESELLRDSAARGPLSFAVGNACDMGGHEDNSFDIVHSNSVIEHVGDWAKVCDLAREARRLAPAYYIQTPYFWFPFDPHFFRMPFIHWLPVSLRVKLHMRMSAGWADRAENLEQAMRLATSNAMLDKCQMRFLFPDSELQFERVALLPKSIIATRLARLQGG